MSWDLKSFLIVIFIFPILGFSQGKVSSANFKSLAECPSGSQSKVDQVDLFLQGVFQKVKESKEVYSWEMEDAHHRTPRYCVDECACIQKKYIAALKTSPVKGIEILGIRLSGGQGILPVEIKHGEHIASYFYHNATMVKFAADNCYIIADPIMNKDLLSPYDWANNIASLDENTIFVWAEK